MTYRVIKFDISPAGSPVMQDAGTIVNEWLATNQNITVQKLTVSWRNSQRQAYPSINLWFRIDGARHYATQFSAINGAALEAAIAEFFTDNPGFTIVDVATLRPIDSPLTRPTVLVVYIATPDAIRLAKPFVTTSYVPTANVGVGQFGTFVHQTNPTGHPPITAMNIGNAAWIRGTTGVLFRNVNGCPDSVQSTSIIGGIGVCCEASAAIPTNALEFYQDCGCNGQPFNFTGGGGGGPVISVTPPQTTQTSSTTITYPTGITFTTTTGTTTTSSTSSSTTTTTSTTTSSTSSTTTTTSTSTTTTSTSSTSSTTTSTTSTSSTTQQQEVSIFYGNTAFFYQDQNGLAAFPSISYTNGSGLSNISQNPSQYWRRETTSFINGAFLANNAYNTGGNDRIITALTSDFRQFARSAIEISPLVFSAQDTRMSLGLFSRPNLNCSFLEAGVSLSSQSILTQFPTSWLWTIRTNIAVLGEGNIVKYNDVQGGDVATPIGDPPPPDTADSQYTFTYDFVPDMIGGVIGTINVELFKNAVSIYSGAFASREAPSYISMKNGQDNINNISSPSTDDRVLLGSKNITVTWGYPGARLNFGLPVGCLGI